MSVEEKEKFQDLSKEDRNRYENQREEFANHKDEDQDPHKMIDTVRSRAEKVAT